MVSSKRVFFFLFLMVVMAIALTESASIQTTKRPSSKNRRPISKTTKSNSTGTVRTASSGAAKPPSAVAASSRSSAKPSTSTSTPAAVTLKKKVPIPASSRRAAVETQSQHQDPEVTKLMEDMDRIEQMGDPNSWEDTDLFNDLDPLMDPLMGSNDLLDDLNDPFPDDYEDLLFEDYGAPGVGLMLPETHSRRRPADSSVGATSGRYLATEVCGRKFYCRRGDRGPCQPNEIFTPIPNTTATATTTVITKPSCGNIISYPYNGCLPAGRVGVSATVAGSEPKGCCSVRFPQRPCFGFPTNYRFSTNARRCYPCATNSWNNGWSNTGMVGSGPCPPNKIFVDVDGVNGMCRCRDRNQLLSKIDDRCHRVYAKGPCGEGQWLEPDSNGYGICRRSPCPSSKCDGRHIYWRPEPDTQGGCYKSFTRGPCRRGSYFLVEDYPTRSGRCVSQYGSSFNPIRMGNNYNNNRGMSPWNNFGMFPPFGPFDQDFGEADYDELNWDY